MTSAAFTHNVRRSFSGAAQTYDAAAALQRVIGEELSAAIPIHTKGRILDVGCGTGNVLAAVKHRFPDVQPVGLDLAEGMLMEAARVNPVLRWRLVQGNAQALPFKNSSFDAVISNLSLQWVVSPAAALREMHRVLVPGGGMTAALFGAGTCAELFESLNAAGGNGIFRRLPCVDDMRAGLLAAGFNRVDVRSKRITVEFDDAITLLRWLKNTGANAAGPRPMFMGKNLLARLESHYRRLYPSGSGIACGFETIWIQGSKP